jgi:hypothetical protein
MVQKTCRHDTVMHGDPMPDPPASLNGARVVLVEDQQQPRPVPALLVSAFSEQQVPRLAVAAFARQLLKPIDPWHLGRIIADVLRGGASA